MADKEKYFIPIEGKLIEVEENVYVAYYKMDRRERYLEERDRDNGVVYNNNIDSQGIDGESGLQDVVTETMETITLANELRNQLHRCIAALPKAERELIHAMGIIWMTKLNKQIEMEQKKQVETKVARAEKYAKKISGWCYYVLMVVLSLIGLLGISSSCCFIV